MALHLHLRTIILFMGRCRNGHFIMLESMGKTVLCSDVLIWFSQPGAPCYILSPCFCGDCSAYDLNVEEFPYWTVNQKGRMPSPKHWTLLAAWKRQVSAEALTSHLMVEKVFVHGQLLSKWKIWLVTKCTRNIKLQLEWDRKTSFKFTTRDTFCGNISSVSLESNMLLRLTVFDIRIYLPSKIRLLFLPLNIFHQL